MTAPKPSKAQLLKQVSSVTVRACFYKKWVAPIDLPKYWSYVITPAGRAAVKDAEGR